MILATLVVYGLLALNVASLVLLVYYKVMGGLY